MICLSLFFVRNCTEERSFDMQQEEKIQDRAVLVGLVGKGETQESVDRSLDELEGLLKTAGGSCVAE